MIEKCFKVVIEHYRRCRDGSKSVKKEIIYNSTLPKVFSKVLYEDIQIVNQHVKKKNISTPLSNVRS